MKRRSEVLSICVQRSEIFCCVVTDLDADLRCKLVDLGNVDMADDVDLGATATARTLAKLGRDTLCCTIEDRPSRAPVQLPRNRRTVDPLRTSKSPPRRHSSSRMG